MDVNVFVCPVPRYQTANPTIFGNCQECLGLHALFSFITCLRNTCTLLRPIIGMEYLGPNPQMPKRYRNDSDFSTLTNIYQPKTQASFKYYVSQIRNLVPKQHMFFSPLLVTSIFLLFVLLWFMSLSSL